MGNPTGRCAVYARFVALLFLLLAFPQIGRPQNNGLQKLFSDYYEFRLRENPGEATFLGRSDYDDRWDDPSPEHQRQYRISAPRGKN
jgi:hypothetical protein